MTLHDTFEPHVAGTAAPATFHELMAGLGYLMFQWSLLDMSLDEEIEHLRRASGDRAGTIGRARTIHERLAEWRALLARGRRRRPDHHAAAESVAARIQDSQRLHACVSAGFAATSTGSEPAIRCVRAAAGDLRLTARDILEAIDAMELCRSEMALLRGLGEH